MNIYCVWNIYTHARHPPSNHGHMWPQDDIQETTAIRRAVYKLSTDTWFLLVFTGAFAHNSVRQTPHATDLITFKNCLFDLTIRGLLNPD